MKFQQVGQQQPGASKLSPRGPVGGMSPLLEEGDAQYLLRMRLGIKNSFADKLAVLKGEEPAGYEHDDPTLRAKGHVFRVPSLLPPQLSFEIAEKVAEQEKKLDGVAVKPPKIKLLATTANTSRVHTRFTHRSELKNLEGWLEKKLSAVPAEQPSTLEYKNMIVGLGMKQLIRLLKTRCEQQGQLLESLWEGMWKICQEVINHLTDELNLCRKQMDKQLDQVERIFVRRLERCTSEMQSLTSKTTTLQKQNYDLNQKCQQTLRTNKQLKIELSEKSEQVEKFQKEYMRVLEDNLLMQLPSMDKREWIRKMYRSVKEYKLRIGKQMKGNVKRIVVERAQLDGQALDIDFDRLEDMKEEFMAMGPQKNQLLDEQFATKNVEIQATVQQEHIRTQTPRIQHATVSTKTSAAEIEHTEVQTIEDWTSQQTLLNINLKLKRDKEKLEQQLRSKPTSGRLSRKDSIGSSIRSINKVSFVDSQVDLAECTEDLQESFEDLLSNSEKKDNQDNLSVQSLQKGKKDREKLLRKGSIRDRPLDKQHFQSSGGFTKRKSTMSNFQMMKFSSRSWENRSRGDQPESPSAVQQQTVMEESDSGSNSNSNSVDSVKNQKKSEKSIAKPKSAAKNANSRMSLSPQMHARMSSSNHNILQPRDINTIREEESVTHRESEKSERCSSQRGERTTLPVITQPALKRVDSEPEPPAYLLQNSNFPPRPLKRLSVMAGNTSLTARNFGNGRKSIISVRSEREKPFDFKDIPTELTGDDAQLLNKLHYYNFAQLSKVKFTRNQLDYRELMKDLTAPSDNTNEKKMEVTIDKELLTVLTDMLKYYRKLKVLKQHSARTFLRNLQPLPHIVVQKFSQKYGVKTLAIKHFRQVLSYLHHLKDKCPRYSLLHLLLFSDFKTLSADSLRLFLKLLNALDAQYTMLKDNVVDKDLDDVELGGAAVVEACLPYFTEPPQRIENVTTVGEYILHSIRQLTVHQSAKSTKLHWLYYALEQQGLQLEVLASFVMNLNLRPDIEMHLLKELVSECDCRSADGRYEISQERFVSFLATTDSFTCQTINQALDHYSSLYRCSPPTPAVLLSLAGDSSVAIAVKRISKYLVDVLTSEKKLVAESQLGWKYLQHYFISRRIQQVTNDILGEFALLGSRDLLILSHDSTLFSIF